MDVTPQELRGNEIKESWRGYDRDEVDDLLERAAVTIEGLAQRLQEAASRPARPAAPVAPEPVPLPSSRDDADMLQRTLLLAQRAADEAVNEAQEKSRQLLEESEAKAQALVSDAETTARRIAEGERRRLEAEIQDLSTRREQLRVDADALDEYASGYRDRLRAAIEADLAKLSGDVEPPSERPELHAVEIPPPAEPAVAVERSAHRPTPPLPPARPPLPQSSRPRCSRPKAPTTSRLDGTRDPTPERSVPSASTRAWVVAATAPFAGLARRQWRRRVARRRSGHRRPSRRAGIGLDRLVVVVVERGLGARRAGVGSTRTLGRDAPQAGTALQDAHAEETALPSVFASDVPMDANPVDTDSLDDDAFFASLREAVRDDVPARAA